MSGLERVRLREVSLYSVKFFFLFLLWRDCSSQHVGGMCGQPKFLLGLNSATFSFEGCTYAVLHSFDRKEYTQEKVPRGRNSHKGWLGEE
jgi:predicted RNA-binding protein associated with RNAse of E/G family